MAARIVEDSATTEFTHFVSIDFGTSGCCIGIATKKNPKGIKVFTAWEGMNTDGKCPTVLLLDPSEQFVSFGQKARTSYTTKNLPHPDRFDDYLLFQNFKTHLYENPDSEEIKAINGKAFPVIEVFAHSLKYLKEQAMKEIKNNFYYSRGMLTVQWILTVPAICSTAAEQTLRRAANKAGFDKNSLVFALEPEAAALSCLQDLVTSKNITETSYLVVDCGGGTIDIAAHKMAIDTKGEIIIEELAPPKRGNHGGFSVNKQFESMLEDLFDVTGEAFKMIKEKCARLWMKMVCINFEDGKCSVRPDDTKAEISVGIHRIIRKEVKEVTGKSIESLVKAFRKYNIEWDEDEDSIVLPYSTICSLYRPALANITKLIDDVLSQSGNVKKVLLVGGLAESSLLFDEVKKSLAEKKLPVEVKRNPQPLFCVAMGAVTFGMNKDIIKSRVMKHSISVEYTKFYKDSSSNLQVLGEELQKLVTQMQSLQQSVQQLQQGLRSEQQKSSSLEARLISEGQKYIALEQTLTKEQQKASTFQTRLTTEEKKVAKLDKILITEQRKSSALEAKLVAKEQESTMLEKGLTTEQQKSAALETNLTSEVGRYTALQIRCESLESSLAAEKKISQLLDANKSQEERLKTMEDTVERLWTISRDEINFSNKIIGTGGWGYVTEATFRGRRVAAKCLHEAIISPHTQELFTKEMKMFARCRHKNLIEFIGAVPDHPAVIITEMMDCTLRFALSNTRVIPNHVHPICIDVAQGLVYLHSIQPHPLIHRDVSAPNVLLKAIGTDWIAKLSDLGSAQFAHIAKTLAPGCVLYSAPEVQQRDTAVKQTEKIDVYSYGVLLIEILTKEMPTGTLAQLINSLQPTRPQFIPLIQQCTNADPYKRPTMSHVISLLNTINI